MRAAAFWGFILNALSACVRTHPMVGVQKKGAMLRGPFFYFCALDDVREYARCVPKCSEAQRQIANRP
jgi:hypothetical protein